MARVSKKPDVFPGKKVRAMAEKMNADNAKPDMTSPNTVVLCVRKEGQHYQRRGFKTQLTILSGKLLATAFNAPQNPASAPIPVINSNNMSVYNVLSMAGSMRSAELS
jgi:hypothetical protein